MKKIITISLLLSIAASSYGQVLGGGGGVKVGSGVTLSDITNSASLAFGGSVWFQELKMGALSYRIYGGGNATNNQEISMTNAPIFAYTLTNTTALRVTNFTHGGTLTLLLNGGAAARVTSWVWPANIHASWRGLSTNATCTNFTIISMFAETNTTGSNVIHIRHDTM